jgi:hypothetical protein
MAAVGEDRRFLEQGLDPRREGRMRQIDISRPHNGRHGVRPRELAALRLHLNQSVHAVPEFLDHSRAIGLVLHQLGARLGPAFGQHADGLFGGGHIHACAALIQQETVRSPWRPTLARPRSAGGLVLEGHIPGLNHRVELRRQ